MAEVEVMVLPKRKNTRLINYDYDSGGVYFITICTRDRKCLLSRIVGDDALGVPNNDLTMMGKIAEKIILSGNQIERVNVEKYVIMPNHIHILLTVDMEGGTPRASSPTNAVVPRFVASFKRFVHKELGEKIFQRSYHDHIIRGHQDYLKIWEYIDNNPKTMGNGLFLCEGELNVHFHR